MGASVEPSETTFENIDFQLFIFQKTLVHSGYLQFAACRGLYTLCHFHHLVGIEIESHHSVVALGVLRFFLNREAIAVFVELGHAVALGVGHPVAEHRGFVFLLNVVYRIVEQLRKAVALENIVAKNKTNAVVADELLPYDESLCQAVG